MMVPSHVEIQARILPGLSQLEVRISRSNRQTDWFSNRYNPSFLRSYIQFLNLLPRRRHNRRRRANCHSAAECRLLAKALRRSILDRKKRLHPNRLLYRFPIMCSMRNRRYGRVPPDRTLRQCDPSLPLTPKDLQYVTYCKSADQKSNVNRRINLRATRKGYSRLWKTTSSPALAHSNVLTHHS